jgi:hypothetical protein
MITLIITMQQYSYTYGQDTGNQTGSTSEQEFEEGEEIGGEETL